MNPTIQYRRLPVLILCLVLALVFVFPAHPTTGAYAETGAAGENQEPTGSDPVPEETPPDETTGLPPGIPINESGEGSQGGSQEQDTTRTEPEGTEETGSQGGTPAVNPPVSDPSDQSPDTLTEGSPDEQPGDDLPPEESIPAEPQATFPPEEIAGGKPNDDLPPEDPPDDDPSVIPPARTFTAAGPLVNPVTLGNFPARSPSKGGSAPEGLFLDKTAVYDEEAGHALITLDVFTSGDVITSQIPVPTDICLVLDQSGSMDWDFDGTTTRQAALKTAVVNFINAVETNAVTNSVDHKIGIVTFASSSSIRQYLSVDYGAARSIINGLGTPSGATNAGAGMASAITVMAGSSTGRNKVVVMFTDGVPTTSTPFDVGVANTAVNNALTLKQGGSTVFAVGIFAGANPAVMWGDSTNYAGQFDTYSDGTLNSYWDKKVTSYSGTSTQTEPPAANRFMNLLSSNSTTANNTGLSRSTINRGSLWIPDYRDTFTITKVYTREKTQYYLSASNTSGLNNIFESIAHTIETPTIELDASTIVRDVVAPHFQVPDSVSAITLQLADCTGFDTGSGKYTFGPPYAAPSAVTASIDPVTKTVSVTGFDYNANFVAKEPKGGTTNDYGRKLIISFPVTPDPTFFGGNGVETNVNTSGVYKPGVSTPVGTFPVPDVDVPLKYEVMENQVQKEYLGNPVDIAAAIQFVTDGLVSYQPDGFNNDHVRITYEIYDGAVLLGTFVINAGEAATSGSWSGTPVVPAADSNHYTVKVTVEPSLAGSITDPLIKDTGLLIYRYRPAIETRDETIYLGQETSILPTSWPHYAKIGWKCRDNPDNSGIHGTEPQLTLTPIYVSGTVPGDPAHFAPTEESEFKVQVKWANTAWPSQPQHVDITDACWLYRAADGYSEKGSNPDFRLPFWIFLLTCRITVTKQATAGTVIGSNESFMIDVSDTHGHTWRLRLCVDGSATLLGLPIGVYTVKEDPLWSWQYTPSPGSVSVELKPNASEDHASVLVTNGKAGRWITGETFVMNLFKGLLD